MIDDRDGQDVPLVDYSFESTSPSPDESNSLPPQAPMPFIQVSVESDNESAVSSDAINSASSEQEWIDNSMPQPHILNPAELLARTRGNPTAPSI